MSDSVEIELRGVLEKISNRFWNGWGFGEISTEEGRIKITGALEGHVEGTSLVVRGSYKETAYGRQLDCSAIIVDAVSGHLNVIRAWVRKALPELEPVVVQLCRFLDASERWSILTNTAQLIEEGLSGQEAVRITQSASMHLRFIEMKRSLMVRGFTDREADRMWSHSGEGVLATLDEDPYSFVIEQILSFHRIDAVVHERFPRNAPQRLRAAMVQALVSGLKHGHTAMPLKAVLHEAAELTGVYPEAVQRVELPVEALTVYRNTLQLRIAAQAEDRIGSWILKAVELEA